MRAIALLQTYNEARFIRASLTHLISQGLEIYLIDNGSTDRTLEIARSFVHRGVTTRKSIWCEPQFDQQIPSSGFERRARAGAPLIDAAVVVRVVRAPA
jgi:GT2 family glycosyltransferase